MGKVKVMISTDDGETFQEYFCEEFPQNYRRGELETIKMQPEIIASGSVEYDGGTVTIKPSLAREDALSAIQRRLFSCDHEQLAAIMKTIYRVDVSIVSEIKESPEYSEFLKEFE